MTVGVRMAGPDPAGAASAPLGVGGGMQQHHHRPPPAAGAQAAPRDGTCSACAGACNGGDGGDGSGGHAGDAGGRAAAAGALRDAHRRACGHGTHAGTREAAQRMGQMGRVCELWRRMHTSETASKLLPIAP